MVFINPLLHVVTYEDVASLTKGILCKQDECMKRLYS
jgi:hypothetical protein